MKRVPWLAALFLLVHPAAAAEKALPKPKPVVSGLKNPVSATVGLDNRVYVTVAGEFDKAGDGAVVVLDKGKAKPFATGLDDPRGIVAFFDGLFVADRQ